MVYFVLIEDLRVIRFQAEIGDVVPNASPGADVPTPRRVATPGHGCSTADWRLPLRNVQASEPPAIRAVDEPAWLLSCPPRGSPTRYP